MPAPADPAWAFRAGTGRVDYALGPARGERYGEVSSELEAELARLIAGDTPAGVDELKPGAVWRRGELVLKTFPPARGVREWLRPVPAIRAARGHFKLLPVASPPPLVALGLGETRASWLVSRYVEGQTLLEVWGVDERAMDALAPFMVQMHARRMAYGDLHPGNLLWDGATWWLLDLAGLRPRTHALLFSRLRKEQWARMCLGLWLDPRLEPIFEKYAEAAGWPRDPKRTWTEIRARAEELARGRGLSLPPPLPGWDAGRAEHPKWKASGRRAD